MTPAVVTVTQAELEKRRAEVLHRIGMSMDELIELESTTTLTGELYEAVDELDDVAFLLGEGRFPPAS